MSDLNAKDVVKLARLFYS